MDERSSLRFARVAGAIAIAIGVALGTVLPQTAVHEVPQGLRSPVLGLELARSPDDVLDILGDGGDPARDATVEAMDRGNRLDFLFLLAYPAFHGALAAILFARRRISNRLFGALLALSLAMSVGDGLENVELLGLSRTTDASALQAPLAALWWWTRLKWVAIELSSALLAVGIARDRTRWRWAAPFFALAALAGLTALVWVPALEASMLPLAIGWLVTLATLRATPAPADLPDGQGEARKNG